MCTARSKCRLQMLASPSALQQVLNRFFTYNNSAKTTECQKCPDATLHSLHFILDDVFISRANPVSKGIIVNLKNAIKVSGSRLRPVHCTRTESWSPRGEYSCLFMPDFRVRSAAESTVLSRAKVSVPGRPLCHTHLSTPVCLPPA